MKSLDKDISETVKEFARYFKHEWTMKRKTTNRPSLQFNPDALMETETETRPNSPSPPFDIG
jgi:hypothetical protein